MTRVPPGLLGAALLFWGWRNDMLDLALAAAVVLELVHLIRVRWDFTDTEFNRIWDVCALILLGVGLFLRFSDEEAKPAYKFFAWLPLVFFPMAFGHLYSSRDTVPMKAFSWFLRRKRAEGGERPVAFGWVYFALCLVTAGASNMRDIFFYPGILALGAWALWAISPRRASPAVWIATFAAVAATGWLWHTRMPELQAYLEGKAVELLTKFGRRDFNPRESRTGLGRLGELKQSGEIVMKVRPEYGKKPERLRQGSFLIYEDERWRGGRGTFEAVPIEPDISTWTLLPGTNTPSAVRIIGRLDRKAAFLSLPLGTAQLRDLQSGGVETNNVGVVRATENPAVASFLSLFDERYSSDREPVDPDLWIPTTERVLLRQIADQLNLRGKPVREVIQGVHAYFAENFRYTTYQAARELGYHSRTPLGEFLTKTRAGHCEFFATATVLLLRELGIPARYAVGYALPESIRQGDSEQYVVRRRHGHAWTMVWTNRRWIEVDTTPAGWAALEEQEFPVYQPFSDWLSGVGFSFMEWRWLGDRAFLRWAALAVALPLTLFLGWRIFARRMVAARPRRLRRSGPGHDSEFYQVEKILDQAGLARQDIETFAQWQERVRTHWPEAGAALPNLLPLHLRLRFDPVGLDPIQRRQLRDSALASAERLRTAFQQARRTGQPPFATPAGLR